MILGIRPWLRSGRCSAAIASAAVLLALAATAALAASAQAATYTVGTTSDTVPGVACEPASGKCSLRQLIEYENALTPTPSPPDVIVVPSGTYELKDGPLTITQSLVIVGAGARTTTVDVSPNASPQRVFDIQTPVSGAPTVGIAGLEIAEGTADADESYGEFGGDVRNTGSLLLSEDWITGGTASYGGGISNDAGMLALERSLVSGNHASTGPGDSGGIQNYGYARCGDGGCLPGTKAVLAVEDSTIAENEADQGAGIFSWAEDGVADENVVSVINSTIAYNKTAEACLECVAPKGAGLLATDGTIDVAGSILAYNSGTIGGEYTPSNCSTSGSATIVSIDYNLETETDCGFKSTGDLQNTSPDFSSGEPQNNGGNTDTFAPEPTSPAVDAIPTDAPFCNGTDQRGISRPQGAGCDIGAVELVPFTIETTEGSQFSGQLATASCGVFGTPTITWGDGQTSKATVANSSISGTHTYAEAGIYNGSVSYEDDCGSHKVAFQAKVADASLSATGLPVSATAGVQFKDTVATFTDANPDGVVSDYTASIDWGDGSSSTAGTVSAAAGGGFEVTGSHTYATAGQYTTSITINDVGGAKATATGSAHVVEPPVVSNVKVLSVTETTATIGFTIDPDGADTTYVIEYGPNTSYGQKTAPVDIGATPGPQPLTQTLTGLEPGKIYHFDVLATNSAVTGGVGVSSGDQPFTTVQPSPPIVPPAPPASPEPKSGVLGFQATLAALPPPVLGKTVNVTLVSGIVYIELPPGATLASAASVSPFAPFALGAQAIDALTKGRAFVPLTEARQIPVGSILETTHGVVGITTATTASPKGKLQSGDFGAGIFKLLQGRRQKGLTELNIINNLSANQVCTTLGKKARIASSHLSTKVLGQLNSSGHGHFTARGQDSAATVRGTIWSVKNQCDGTLTHVKRGVVSVRDFIRRKTITLFTGQSYLARGPVRRG